MLVMIFKVAIFYPVGLSSSSGRSWCRWCANSFELITSLLVCFCRSFAYSRWSLRGRGVRREKENLDVINRFGVIVPEWRFLSCNINLEIGIQGNCFTSVWFEFVPDDDEKSMKLTLFHTQKVLSAIHVNLKIEPIISIIKYVSRMCGKPANVHVNGDEISTAASPDRFGFPLRWEEQPGGKERRKKIQWFQPSPDVVCFPFFGKAFHTTPLKDEALPRFFTEDSRF